MTWARENKVLIVKPTANETRGKAPTRLPMRGRAGLKGFQHQVSADSGPLASEKVRFRSCPVLWPRGQSSYK